MSKAKHYGKSVRKVVKVGECSGVTLPKEYLDNHNLKVGDHVEVVFNNILKLAPLHDKDIKKELGEGSSEEG